MPTKQDKQENQAVARKSASNQISATARAPTFQEEFERLVDAFFGRGLSPWRSDWSLPRSLPAAFEGKTPRVNVIDRDDEMVVHAELPGVDKENLDVTVDDGSLTIRATSRHEQKEEKGDYHRREISAGSFSRTISLPQGADSSKARATFKDGLLELTMPKREVARRKQVPIS